MTAGDAATPRRAVLNIDPTPQASAEAEPARPRSERERKADAPSLVPNAGKRVVVTKPVASNVPKVVGRIPGFDRPRSVPAADPPPRSSRISQSPVGSVGASPAEVTTAPFERTEVRGAAAWIARGAFPVLAGVTDQPDVMVLDGVEVDEARFARLLRVDTDWRPNRGLLLTFARVDEGSSPARGSRRNPLAPRPEDWPRLLEWSRGVGTLLGTRVHVVVPANTNLLLVPADVLDAYQAYGPVEAARLMRDWRTETHTSSIVLSHLPPDAPPGDSDIVPGPSWVALPERSEGPLGLIGVLRQAIETLDAERAGRSEAAAAQVAAAAARIRRAVGAQAAAQAAINAEFGLEGCSPWELTVLRAGRIAPPVLARWTAPVPLVLVDCFYAPVTRLPRPLAEAPGEIAWLRPATEQDLLRSVAELAELAEFAGPAPAAHQPRPAHHPRPAHPGR